MELLAAGRTSTTAVLLASLALDENGDLLPPVPSGHGRSLTGLIEFGSRGKSTWLRRGGDRSSSREQVWSETAPTEPPKPVQLGVDTGELADYGLPDPAGRNWRWRSRR